MVGEVHKLNHERFVVVSKSNLSKIICKTSSKYSTIQLYTYKGKGFILNFITRNY